MSEPVTPPSGDWKVEAVRSARTLPIDFLKVGLNMVFVSAVCWFSLTYAMTKMDGHVDKLSVRDVEIKKQHDDTIKAITTTNDSTLKALGEQHVKAATEMKEGFREAADRNERLYERLMNRPTSTAATKGN